MIKTLTAKLLKIKKLQDTPHPLLPLQLTNHCITVTMTQMKILNKVLTLNVKYCTTVQNVGRLHGQSNFETQHLVTAVVEAGTTKANHSKLS